MKDAALTMIIYPFDDQRITWNVTCVYPFAALARVFYKDMTREIPHELVNAYA